MNKARIRKERFLNWVEQQPLNKVLGSTRNPNDTPLYRYLKQRSLGTVTTKFRRAEDNVKYQDTGWVREFLVNLANHKSANITTRSVLKMLL